MWIRRTSLRTMTIDELLLKFLLCEGEPPSREEALITLTDAVLVMPQLSLSIQNPLLMPEEALLVHN